MVSAAVAHSITMIELNATRYCNTDTFHKFDSTDSTSRNDLKITINFVNLLLFQMFKGSNHTNQTWNLKLTTFSYPTTIRRMFIINIFQLKIFYLSTLYYHQLMNLFHFDGCYERDSTIAANKRFKVHLY